MRRSGNSSHTYGIRRKHVFNIEPACMEDVESVEAVEAVEAVKEVEGTPRVDLDNHRVELMRALTRPNDA
ncbi:hypothetical protein V493_04934 [Pseudogymnoascus sp. VKM F-4281 (FW-2241)]|nr:hypothetical protein V493_04934 [Pseudogymnoascus sp. VKM F-4281 (FW-2241)]